jgi:pimeloyl-ACP methyl ester carboxylesterase
MNKLFLFLIIAFFQILAFAGWTQGTLALSRNRVLVYEYYDHPGSSSTLVFLPGIYRGYLSNDKFVAAMVKHKMSFVLFHFAEQPDSVVNTEKNPDFSGTTPKVLADEVLSLVKALELKNAIPVTLSYSAITTAQLDRNYFPVVIETSPIGRDTDDLPPAVSAFYETWEAWVKTVPFYGEAWLNQTKEIQLRQYWSPWIDKYQKRLPQLKDEAYRERALQGYVSLTRASEGFDLRVQNFRQGPDRYFILGDQEDEMRASYQNEAITSYQKQTGHTENVYTVKGAGHVVSSDKPDEYVDVLRSIQQSFRK